MDFVALRAVSSNSAPPQLADQAVLQDQWQRQQHLAHGANAAPEVAAWLLPSHALAGVAVNSSAVLVGGVQHQDAAVPLYDVELPYRDALALYRDSVVAVPLGAGPLLMFVRTDVVGAQVGRGGGTGYGCSTLPWWSSGKLG